MWMYTLFPQILNMSLTASIVIVFVLLARLLLQKTPKIFSYALWAVVLFRLLCPVSMSSEWSLLKVFDVPLSEAGSMEYIPTDIVHTENLQVNIPAPGISEAIETPMAVAIFVWLIGMFALLLHSAISLIKLRRKLIGAVHLRDNVYLADYISSPFVLGLLRPKIYLPSKLTEQEQTYIIQHEQHHIRRFDPIVKILAFAALCVHWFNPLVWLAFMLSGKDMEMSCDEAVMKSMDSDIRAEYSTSLLSLATGRKIIAGTPLAFGEGDTKSRIQNVLNYKKPALWVITVSVITVVALGVGLMANPNNKKDARLPLQTYIYEKSSEVVKPSVTLDENGKFTFVFSAISSYIGRGSYEIDGNQLLLKTDDSNENYHYLFDIENNMLVFDADNSSSMIWFANLPDGAVLIGDRDNTTPYEYEPAIMINDAIYWLSPNKSIMELPQTAWLFGQIKKVSPPNAPPDENFEAIGLDDSWIGKDFFIAADGNTIYLKGADEKYMQFLFEE